MAMPWELKSAMVTEEKYEGQKARQNFNKMKLGVAFRGLNCHGFVTATRHQLTFLDYALAVPRLIAAGFRLPPKEKVQILHNIEGLILPGEMVIVLGRPGAGCSTFLKSVSGDIRGFRIEDEDSINYQGISFGQFHNVFKGERVYVAELDVHFPELTLGQTLDFALSTRQQSAASGSGLDTASRFGLTEAYNTQVGDALIRGISGGEKRRTSIAEAYIGGAQFQCWDNSTRGLDAVTARQFVRLLRESTTIQKSTVAMSLYQASEDMYQCFDHVLLLYEGYQIYYGPVLLAVDYFTRLGFVRSSRTTTADFLTSLTSPAERIVREGYENRVPHLPEEFANVWKHSTEARSLRITIGHFNALHPKSTGHSDDDLEKMTGLDRPSIRTSTYPLSIVMQLLVCLRRAFQRLQRNIAAEISAVIANTILGVIIGSVFYNLSETAESIERRCLLLFFALMVNAFVTGNEVIVMWAQRPIVEKHHRYAFYHPFVERLSSIICDLPAKVIICFNIHLPIYFMSNLRQSATAFFVYWLFMFTNLVTMSMLFRMIGSVSRTREQTTTPVSAAVLLFIIYTGFIVPPAYMKPWLGWVYRINPLAYTYESLLINEMHDRLFPCSSMIPDGESYNSVSLDQKTCATIGSTVGQQNVEGSTYIALRYEYFGSHLWRNLAIMLAMMVVFCIVHLLTSEYIAAQPPKGEILRFRHRQSAKKNVDLDRWASLLPLPINEANRGTSGINQGKSRTKAGNDIATISPQAGEFHWSNLNYEVNGRKILNDVHGWVKPRALTALMGVTGAGKTSLLNALANRTTGGKVSGDVFVNGQARDASFRRKVGYVQQEDIHLATSTIREALEFSALLRQPASTSKAEKLAYVDSVLDMMDMQWYADAIIGVPGEGLNVEQRKRLTIAVEMVAKPELLLFLDEPTSGLDSQTAWSICTLLRKLADNGQTILCTIHQPSSQLFQMFDRLLLLGKGGNTIYFGDIGDNASTVIQYFEKNSTLTCNLEANPAEWILEVTNEQLKLYMETKTDTPQWPEIWDQSPEKKEVLDQIASLNTSHIRAVPSSLLKKKDGKYAASLFQQMKLMSKRILQDQWRDPVYIYSKIALSVCLALLNGISFYNSTLDVQGVTNLLFSIFLITQLFSCVDQLVIPHFSNGQSLFEARDRNSNTYSWVVFVSANVLIELLWQTIIAVPIFVAWYYPTGLQHSGDSTFNSAERGILTFLLIWLFNLWASTISQAFAASISNTEVAMQMATLFYWLALVFCGILAPPQELAHFWIFMYRISPLTYFLEGLAVAGLANAKIACSSIEALLIQVPNELLNSSTCGQYLAAFVEQTGGQVLNPLDSLNCQYCPYSDVNLLLQNFGMVATHTWRNVGLMAVYVSVNILLTFGLYWLVRVFKISRYIS